MTAEQVGHFEPGSPEWHEARRTGLGGSEIAAVLGISPFESRFSLWHRKRGEVGPVEMNEAMEWGHRLEAAVADKFADEHPDWKITPAGTWRHRRRPWQIANPDRFIGQQTTLLEVKTVPSFSSWAWGPAGSQEIPVHYRVQVQWYLDVFGFDHGWVAVLIGGCEYREYRIDADPAEQRMLRSEAQAFLDSLDSDDRPDIDGHTATYDTVRELHPDIDPGIDADITAELAEKYVTARQWLADAEANDREAKALLMDAMGSARRAIWDGHTIATRQARNGGDPFIVAGRNLPDFTATDHQENDAA